MDESVYDPYMALNSDGFSFHFKTLMQISEPRDVSRRTAYIYCTNSDKFSLCFSLALSCMLL